jgi:hypothetical protein
LGWVSVRNRADRVIKSQSKSETPHSIIFISLSLHALFLPVLHLRVCTLLSVLMHTR